MNKSVLVLPSMDEWISQPIYIMSFEINLERVSKETLLFLPILMHQFFEEKERNYS